MGDIAASWALQVGNQSHPRLRSPLLDRIAGIVESRTKMFWVLGLYISESRIPFTPQSLRRSGEASWRRSSDFPLLKFHLNFFLDHAGIMESFRWFCDENIVLGASWHLGVVAVSRGVELRGVVVTILSLQFWNTWVSPTSKISFMQFVGEITSTPPSTRAGVLEYCHNSYNGCFSKVEVNDFRRFLSYVLKDGYSWM